MVGADLNAELNHTLSVESLSIEWEIRRSGNGLYLILRALNGPIISLNKVINIIIIIRPF